MAESRGFKTGELNMGLRRHFSMFMYVRNSSERSERINVHFNPSVIGGFRLKASPLERALILVASSSKTRFIMAATSFAMV